MNEVDVLRDLQSRCGNDGSTPGVDVTADVLATIRRRAGSGVAFGGASRVPSLLAATAVAWSAALLLVVLALQAAAALDDPFNSLIAPFVVTLR